MSQVNHQFVFSGWALRAGVAGALSITVVLLVKYVGLPSYGTLTAAATAPASWPLRCMAPIIKDDASLFVASVQSKVKDMGALSSRLRLAGTFVSSDSEGDRRQAVLDDLSANRQFIVAEADILGDVTVVSILRDSIILRGANGEEQLWLSFLGRSSPGSESGGAGLSEQPVNAVRDSTGDRYGGRQVGERNWVFQRQSIVDYYSELMDNPDRLLQVFDSLKPIYGKDQKIVGYRIGLEGEAEFFKSAGLQENDVILSVNSVRMTNRRRAEFFIKEFVNNRANAFVIDVQRGGKTEKFVYQLR